jgi:hypothetical protein
MRKDRAGNARNRSDEGWAVLVVDCAPDAVGKKVAFHIVVCACEFELVGSPN